MSVDEKLLSEVRRQGHTYKVGDEVTGFVTGIEEYGVFLENYDTRLSGLIHKSNVQKGGSLFLNERDLEQRFRLGDSVTAKIVDIRNGKYSLSTVGYALPKYELNSLGNLIKREDIEVSDDTRVTEKTSDLDEIFQEMRSKVGGISTVSATRVSELVGKYGIVKFSMALSRALESYTPIDQSLLLVEEIEKQAGVKSPKRTFIIGTHAKERWVERGDGGDLMDRICKSNLLYEDIHNSRRLFGDGEFTFPCTITENGENAVRTVENWGGEIEK